ncbi:MAG: RNA recognition motif domain-containing protein [Dehalococcoidia bacterium]
MKKLYIGNVSYQASEQDLRDWFVNAGIHVDSVTLIRDSYTNQPRGFGFAEISSDEEAERAIQELNGKEFLGRALVVNEARPRREGGRGRGERGGRGGGRRRGW